MFRLAAFIGGIFQVYCLVRPVGEPIEVDAAEPFVYESLSDFYTIFQFLTKFTAGLKYLALIGVKDLRGYTLE